MTLSADPPVRNARKLGRAGRPAASFAQKAATVMIWAAKLNKVY